jgi:hypothetical protein
MLSMRAAGGPVSADGEAAGGGSAAEGAGGERRPRPPSSKGSEKSALELLRPPGFDGAVRDPEHAERATNRAAPT